MVREAKAFLAAALVLGSLSASGCLSARLPPGTGGRGSCGSAVLSSPRGRAESPPPLEAARREARPPAYPLLAREVSAALPSDMGDFEIPEEVSLPPRERWPRTFADAGPFYALAQFSPLVAPLGALKESGRADVGLGIGALFGYKLPLSNALALGLEVQIELSGHANPSTPADLKAQQTRTGVAVRAMFRFDEELRPFGVAGGGRYSMTFDDVSSDFHLFGLGVFLGGGVDYVQSDRLTIRGEMTLHIWDAAERGDPDKGGIAQTLFLGAGAAFTF